MPRVWENRSSGGESPDGERSETMTETRRCEALDCDESALYTDGEECQQPATDGITNKESGYTIPLCRAHYEDYCDLRGW